MAAYAALVSLTHLTEQINHHPHPPVALDGKQSNSLTAKIRSLQRFLEDFHARGLSQEIQDFETRIADVAHAAQDVIESHAVTQILLASASTTKHVIEEKETSTDDMFEALQRIIQGMEIIEKEATDTMKKKKKKPRDKDGGHMLQSSLLPRDSSAHAENTAATTVVGFEEISIRIMELLTGNNQRREIIPITGMGGSGKTTLARTVYEKPLVAEHFHTRSWATISQEFSVREVLIEILLSLSSNRSSTEDLGHESEEELGDQLYKSLFGKKYLIAMDDVWSLESWEKLKFFFPENNNGSRIMMTSRLSKLAFEFGSLGIEISPLDEDTSFGLLREKVFPEKRSFPLELKEIGRKIARNCRGLPLSIVTIGGLLAKSEATREYWEYVAGNLSSLVNSEDDERCLNVLSLSYVNLPVHVKPCFLYTGIFREDEIIRASYVIKLWVAEGFLKPVPGKSSEASGEECLTDLAERNLIIVVELGSTGKIKSFVVHDLLRDLCLREARKERFLSVARIGEEIDGAQQRRIAIHGNASKEEEENKSPRRRVQFSSPFLRSCIIESEKVLKSILLRRVPLLRILAAAEGYAYRRIANVVPPLVNSRLLSFNSHFDTSFEDISFVYLCWNLQTLMVDGYMSSEDGEPLDIWRMSQLRHVKFKSDSVDLSDPREDGGRILILENLQTLSKVNNFICSGEVVRRIPNVRKLGICYYESQIEGKTSMDYNLDNLGALQKLESLAIEFCPNGDWWNWFDDGLGLPRSLKKLSLEGTGFEWDGGDAMATIGNLPLLEVLKLDKGAFVGDEWNPVEGNFLRLKYLVIGNTDLKRWNADNSHFPRLEHLRIVGGRCLEEVPWGIGDITTLRLIDLADVRESAVVSAKRMLVEQEEQLGNVTLEIRVMIYRYQSELESLAGHNFKMERILSCTVM